MDRVYETNTQLELGTVENIVFILSLPFIPEQVLCLFPLQTFLTHSWGWIEIRKSLCPIILEYSLLISQFKFQLGKYILPTSNSSVISIGYGVLHSLNLAALLGAVQRQTCSISYLLEKGMGSGPL